MNVQIASVGMIYWGKSLGGRGLELWFRAHTGFSKDDSTGTHGYTPAGTKEGANTDGSEGGLLD